MNPYEKCGYCKKIVKCGRFLGTLHLCVTQEERNAVDNFRATMQVQRQFISRNGAKNNE